MLLLSLAEDNVVCSRVRAWFADGNLKILLNFSGMGAPLDLGPRMLTTLHGVCHLFFLNTLVHLLRSVVRR